MSEAANEQRDNRRWWIALAILVGTWSGTSLNSMIPVALPSRLSDFEIGVDVGVWIISIFVLLAAVAVAGLVLALAMPRAEISTEETVTATAN